MNLRDRALKRFNTWAQNYDRCILQRLVFDDSHTRFMKEINPVPNMRILVLDMACGTGKFSLKLAKAAPLSQIKGVDYSPKMIEMAKRKLQKSGLSNVEFKEGSVSSIPYSDSTFDIVVCSNAFHHFYPNQQRALEEMHRVLKVGGKVLIIDGCKDRLIGRVIFGCFVRQIEKNVHHCMKQEIRDLMYYSGFHRIKQEIINIFIPLLFSVGIKY